MRPKTEPEHNSEFIADLHIHSRYSRACSKSLSPATVAHWAQLKGIKVVGTGDITHPSWLQELEAALVEDGTGLLSLRSDLAEEVAASVPPSCRFPVRFMLTGEVSTIYRSGERTRKLHHVIFLPDFASARKFAEKLGELGTITSDGRPILGVDSRVILELLLSLDNGAFLVPAHIWTQWFSLLGAKSGFDSVEECFGDLASEIFALETGLSSDPPMNWRLSALDRYTLISNSDAHSPRKLARECNLFKTELSFDAIRAALKSGEGFLGTIEFFPEEGKYHYDGHRSCGVRLSPSETRALGGKCPVCGKPVTVGVMHRVEQLADRPHNVSSPKGHTFERLIPLEEVIAESVGAGPGTKRVQKLYFHLLSKLGPELEVLRKADLEAVGETAGPAVGEALRRVRNEEVYIAAGYDGVFGSIHIFDQEERQGAFVQLSLF